MPFPAFVNQPSAIPCKIPVPNVGFSAVPNPGSRGIQDLAGVFAVRLFEKRVPEQNKFLQEEIV